MIRTDEIEETFVEKLERLAGLCIAAQEAFEPDTAPWRWLNDTATAYIRTAELLIHQETANDRSVQIMVKS